MNKVLKLILDGNALAALQLYQNLPHASGDDQRWGGLSLLYNQYFEEAKDALTDALGSGNAAARIELSAVYRQTGEIDLAEKMLDLIDPTALDVFDRILFHREKGCLNLTLGNLKESIVSLELAYIETSSHPMGLHLKNGILNVLGLALASRGNDKKALKILDSCLKEESPSRNVYALAARSMCYMYMGDIPKAQADLDAAMGLIDLIPISRPLIFYNQGILLRSQEYLKEAAMFLEKAAKIAYESDSVESECYAEIALSSIYVVLDAENEARRHLARARAISTTGKLDALIDLREGAILTKLGFENAKQKLLNAEEAFIRLALKRELGWTYLHLAEAALKVNDDEFADCVLEKAVNVKLAFNSVGTLSVELNYLPLTLKYLQDKPHDSYLRSIYVDWQLYYDHVHKKLFISLLSVPRLEIGGQAVKFRLSRSIEILAYIVLNPYRSLDQIVNDLFPEETAKRAKNYFHQVRYEISKKLPGIDIDFNKDKVYYASFTDTNISCDIKLIKDIISTGQEQDIHYILDKYGEELKYESDSEWINQQKQTIILDLFKATLSIARDHFERADFSKCIEICKKYTLIDYFNEEIIRLLTLSTKHAEGDSAYKQLLEEIDAASRKEFGLGYR